MKKIFKHLTIFVFVLAISFCNVRIDLFNNRQIIIEPRNGVFEEAKAVGIATAGAYLLGTFGVWAFLQAGRASEPIFRDLITNSYSTMSNWAQAFQSFISDKLLSRMNYNDQLEAEFERIANEYDQTGKITVPDNLIKDIYRHIADYELQHNISSHPRNYYSTIHGDFALLIPPRDMQWTNSSTYYDSYNTARLYLQPDGRNIFAWAGGYTITSAAWSVVSTDYLRVYKPYLIYDPDFSSHLHITTDYNDIAGNAIEYDNAFLSIRIFNTDMNKLEDELGLYTYLMNNPFEKFYLEDYMFASRTQSSSNTLFFAFKIGGITTAVSTNEYRSGENGRTRTYRGYVTSYEQESQHFFSNSDTAYAHDFSSPIISINSYVNPSTGLPYSYPVSNSGFNIYDQNFINTISVAIAADLSDNDFINKVAGALGIPIPTDKPEDSVWDPNRDVTNEGSGDTPITEDLELAALIAAVGTIILTLDLSVDIGRPPQIPNSPFDMIGWLQWIAKLLVWFFGWILKFLILLWNIIKFFIGLILYLLGAFLQLINIIITFIINQFLTNLLGLISNIGNLTRILPNPLNLISNIILSIVGASVGIRLIRNILSIGRS